MNSVFELIRMRESGRLAIRRLAHPGGAIRTNKAAALAKFLERKLQEPQGLASIDPNLVELAVKNAKDCATASNYFLCKFDSPVLLIDLGFLLIVVILRVLSGVRILD